MCTGTDDRDVARFRRRELLRRGLTVAGAGALAGLVLPKGAAAAGHMYGCGAQFGPLHRYLYATAPDPVWQDAIIWRESNWIPAAYNRSSGASGLAQFIPSTWNWGSQRFGLYGSPFDPYAAIDLMNKFIEAGEYYHWNL